MVLVLNEDQQLLKETAQRFAVERAPVSALRKLRDEGDPVGFDRGLWKDMAELGWVGMVVPAIYGGSEYDFSGLGIVLEEMGRTLAASPLMSTAVLGANAILAGGTHAQKQALLPDIAAGERLTSLAFEEGSHHAPFRILTRATTTDSGNGFVLNGTKRFVLDGHIADTLIVVARSSERGEDSDGLTLFLVDANAPGVNRTRTVMVDSRNAANIELVDVEVPVDAVLGESDAIDRGGLILSLVLDLARIGLSAEMLGGVQEAFQRTLEYLKLREQFGVKIGSFQALKHRAAVMFTEIELAKSTVMAALAAVDEGSSDVALLASLGKAQLSDTYFLASNEAIQMHGGIGMTDEEEIGFFLKRARVAQQTFGDARFHRDRYARLGGF